MRTHVALLLRVGIAGPLAVLLAPSLTGCINTTALRPEHIARVNHTHVRCYVSQTQLKAAHDLRVYSGAGGADGVGLLIGALIDTGTSSARATNAELRVDEIRRVTRDFDIRALYWQAVSKAIPTNSWLRPARFETFAAAATPPTSEELATGSVLNIDAAYILAPDCTMLFVGAKVKLYCAGSPGKPTAAKEVSYFSNPVAIHPFTIGFVAPTNPYSKERDEAARLWTTNNGAAFRAAASEAVAENAKLIGYLLDGLGGITNTAPRAARIRSRLLHSREIASSPFSLTMCTMNGHVLEETPRRCVFRARNGSLFSLPRNEVDLHYIPDKPN